MLISIYPSRSIFQKFFLFSLSRLIHSFVIRSREREKKKKLNKLLSMLLNSLNNSPHYFRKITVHAPSLLRTMTKNFFFTVEKYFRSMREKLTRNNSDTRYKGFCGKANPSNQLSRFPASEELKRAKNLERKRKRERRGGWWPWPGSKRNPTEKIAISTRARNNRATT